APDPCTRCCARRDRGLAHVAAGSGSARRVRRGNAVTLSGEELADARMRLDRDLCLIARNVDFRGSTEARWKASPLPLTQSTQGLSRPASNPAVSQLEQFLYGSFFCRPLRNAVASEPSMHEQDIDLVPVLSAANRGSDGWDPQWQIEEVLPSGQ